jgi:hypothetical protein
MKIYEALEYAESLEEEVGKPLYIARTGEYWYIADLIYRYDCTICGKEIMRDRYDLSTAKCKRCARLCNAELDVYYWNENTKIKSKIIRYALYGQ